MESSDVTFERKIHTKVLYKDKKKKKIIANYNDVLENRRQKRL